MKTNYVLDVTSRKGDHTALFKAKNDIADILKNDGFNVIKCPMFKGRISKLLLAYSIHKKVNHLKDSVFLYQYPIGSNFIGERIISGLKNNNILKIVLIHDLESKRFFLNNKNKQKDEIKFLKGFDYIIVQSELMKAWLVKMGIKDSSLIKISIFDYLTTHKMIDCHFSHKITFAGNLKKATFLRSVNIDSCIQVFGPHPFNDYPNRVIYEGQYNSFRLMDYMDGAFGLVWDGSSTNGCDGIYGNYLRFNIPYKLSLYLAAGMPVIVWKKASIANFIIKNHVGITIDSLLNIDERLNNITLNEYDYMVKNARILGQKLRNGFFTLEALNKIKEI